MPFAPILGLTWERGAVFMVRLLNARSMHGAGIPMELVLRFLMQKIFHPKQRKPKFLTTPALKLTVLSGHGTTCCKKSRPGKFLQLKGLMVRMINGERFITTTTTLIPYYKRLQKMMWTKLIFQKCMGRPVCQKQNLFRMESIEKQSQRRS